MAVNQDPNLHEDVEFGILREMLGPVGSHPPCAWVFTVDCDAMHCALPTVAMCLDSAERSQVLRLTSPLRQRRMATARAALRIALAACLDVTAAEVPLYRSASGQPLLARRPGEPELHLSATRSGSLAAIAISSSGRVGVDLEIVDAQRFSEDIAAEVLTPGECRLLAETPVSQRPEWLAVAWVGKEALLKGLGLGLRLDPRGVGVMAALATTSDDAGWYGGVSLSGWEIARKAIGEAQLALALEPMSPAAHQLRFVRLVSTMPQ